MTEPYPVRWEADVVLADGGAAHLRPIRPDDADRLVAFFSRLSPESIYYRFFSPIRRLPPRDVARFTQVDHVDRAALIVTIGAEMVAVVRYERMDRAQAEVAFVVEDAHQGRGLGTILLEHIAAAARERGIERFVAHVLPENRRMIGVFRQAGYQARQSFEDGVILLTLDLSPTETGQEVRRAREQRAEARSTERLLFPRAIAVVGASRDPRGVGHAVLRHIIDAEFTGPVYPVHRTAASVAAVPAHPGIGDIPGPVDLVVVAVPAEAVLDVVDDCAAKGVHGLVVVSAGFAEAGPAGRHRQEELIRRARAGGMRVVGPNCLGIANTDPAVRLNATLAPRLPYGGPIGFFSQSGALGRAILQRVALRGIGLSTFVSAGNRADVSGNDLLQYWEGDPATEVVLLYLESIGNPRKFTRLARRLARTKPIVAVGSGGTTGVPSGHAARALTLPDHAVGSLLHQAGVIRVDDLTQMFDVAQILAYQPTPAGSGVGIVGNSDSLALLTRDACVRAGLAPRPPLDLGPAATARDFAAGLAELLEDAEVHAVIAVFMPPLGGEPVPAAGWTGTAGAGAGPGGGDDEPGEMLTDRVHGVAEVLRGAAARATKPIIATYLGAEGLPRDLRVCGPDGRAGRGSVPSYPAPEPAVRALAHAVAYAAWRGERDDDRVPDVVADRAAARALVERVLGGAVRADAGRADTARLLAHYGVPVDGAPAEGVPAEGVPAEGGPGVAVRITAGEDPGFGAVVSFGLSGPLAELLHDRAYRLAPLTRRDAGELISAVRAAPLLHGHGGTPPVDTGRLADLLVRIARLADDLPQVHTLVLDPVIVTEAGVRVRDAVLRLAAPPPIRPDTGPRRLRNAAAPPSAGERG